MAKIKIPSIEELKQAFLSHPLVQWFINWTKRTSFPGFFRVPLYDVAIFIYNESRRQSIVNKANSLAFSFFLSLFPSIIVLLTLLPFASEYLLGQLPGGQDFMLILEREIHLIMPGNAGDMLFSTVEDITTRPRAGLLSMGFLLAIYFASNGMITMMRSFEKHHKTTFKRRSGIRKRLIAVALTGLLGLMLVASVVLVILGDLIIHWLSEKFQFYSLTGIAISLLRYFIIISLFYFIISFIYRFGAPVRKKFSFFSPGTTLATILSLLSSVGFSFYVENFAFYNKLYGSIGTIIVVMLWIQINAMVLLIGFELNASIAVNRDLKKEKRKEEET